MASSAHNEMRNLQYNIPQLYEQFRKGKFTVQKSNRNFSKIGLDHNHEQLNCKIKGVGGAIGLTESSSALQRWMIAGPEVARLVEEFEINTTVFSVLEHHDASPSNQENLC